jgi:hypothetical protein
LRDRHSEAAVDARKIAQSKFWIVSSDFVAFAAPAVEIAAMQRGWRDFRMARPSCEHGDLAMPKNWTLQGWRDCINKNIGGFR